MLCVKQTKGHNGDVWKSNRRPERKPERQGRCLLNDSDLREIRLLKSIWFPWLPTRHTLDLLQVACSDIKSQLVQRVNSLDLVVRNPLLTESCLQRTLFRKRLELENSTMRWTLCRESNAAAELACRRREHSRKVGGRPRHNLMSHDDDLAGREDLVETLRAGKKLAKTVGPPMKRPSRMPQQRREKIILHPRVSNGSLVGLENFELNHCKNEERDASPEVEKYSKVPNWFLDLCASGLHLQLESSLPEEYTVKTQELRDLALQPRVLHIQSVPHSDVNVGKWRRDDYFIVTEQRLDSPMNPVFLQHRGESLESSETFENDCPANRSVTSRNANSNGSLEQYVEGVRTNMAVGETRRGIALQVKPKAMHSNTRKSLRKRRKANKETLTFSSNTKMASANLKEHSLKDEKGKCSLQGQRSPSRFSSSLLIRTMARIKAKLRNFSNSMRRPKQEVLICEDAMRGTTRREKGILANDGSHWQSRPSFPLAEVQPDGYQTRLRKRNSCQDKNNSSSHFQDSTYVEYADDRVMVASDHRTLRQVDKRSPSRSSTNLRAHEKSWTVGARNSGNRRLKERGYDPLTSAALLDVMAKRYVVQDISERGISTQPDLFQELRLKIHEFVRAKWAKEVRLFLDREENARCPEGAQNWTADEHVQELAPYDDRRNIYPTVTPGMQCSAAHPERSQVADPLSGLCSSDVNDNETYQGYQALRTYTKDTNFEREQLMDDMKQGSGTFKVCGEIKTNGISHLVPSNITSYRVEETGKTCSHLPTQGPSEGRLAHEDPCNGLMLRPTFPAVYNDSSNVAKDFIKRSKNSTSEDSSLNKLDKESTKLAKLWTQLKCLTETTVEEVRSDEQISPAALGYSTLHSPSRQDASVAAWSRTSSRVGCPCHGPYWHEVNVNASSKPSTTKKKKPAVTTLTVKMRDDFSSTKKCTTDRGTQYFPFSDPSANFMSDTPFNSRVSSHGQSAGMLGKVDSPDAFKRKHQNPNLKIANDQATVSHNGHFSRDLGQTQHLLSRHNEFPPANDQPNFESPHVSKYGDVQNKRLAFPDDNLPSYSRESFHRQSDLYDGKVIPRNGPMFDEQPPSSIPNLQQSGLPSQGQDQRPATLNAPPQNTHVFNAPNQNTQLFHPPNQGTPILDEPNQGALANSERRRHLHHYSYSQPHLPRSGTTAVPRGRSLTNHASSTNNLAPTHHPDFLALGHGRYNGFATNVSPREAGQHRSETVEGYQTGFGAAVSYNPWKKRVEFGHTTVIRDSDSSSRGHVRPNGTSPEYYRHPLRTNGHVCYQTKNPRSPRLADMRTPGSLPRRDSSQACSSSREKGVRHCKSVDSLRDCRFPTKIEDKACYFNFNKADAFTPERLMEFQLQVLSCINQILSTGLSQSARHGGSFSETCLKTPRSALPRSSGCALSQLGGDWLPGVAKGDNTSVASHAGHVRCQNTRIGALPTEASLGKREIHKMGRDGCKASLCCDEQQDTERRDGCKASLWRDEQQFTGRRNEYKASLWRNEEQGRGRHHEYKASLWRKEQRPNVTTRVYTAEAGIQTEDCHSKGSHHDVKTTKSSRAPARTQTDIGSETSDLSWGVGISSVGRSENGRLPAHGACHCRRTDDEHVRKWSNSSNATQTPHSAFIPRNSRVNKKCQVGRSKVNSTAGINVHCSSLTEKVISPSKRNLVLFTDGRNERCDAGQNWCQRPHTGTVEICDDPSVEVNEAPEISHGVSLSRGHIVQRRKRKSHGLIRHSESHGQSMSHYNARLQEKVGSLSTTSDSNDTMDCVKSNRATVKDKRNGEPDNCVGLRVTDYPKDDKTKTDKRKPLHCRDAPTTRASPLIHIRYRVRRNSNGLPSEPHENVRIERKEVGANLESRLSKVMERSLRLQKEILRLYEQRKDKQKVGDNNKEGGNDDGPASVKVSDVIDYSDETSSNDNTNSNAKTSDDCEDERVPTKSNPVSELDAWRNVPTRLRSNASHRKGPRKDSVLLKVDLPVCTEKSYKVRRSKFKCPATDCSATGFENGNDLRCNSRDAIACLERKEPITMTILSNFEKATPFRLDLNKHNPESIGNMQQLKSRERKTNNITKEEGMHVLHASQPKLRHMEMHRVLKEPSRRFQSGKCLPDPKTRTVTMLNPCRKGGHLASPRERSVMPNVRDGLKYRRSKTLNNPVDGDGCVESDYWKSRWDMGGVGMAKTFLSKDRDEIGHQKRGLYDNEIRSGYSESFVKESFSIMKEMRTSDRENAGVRGIQVLEVLDCKRLRKRGCMEKNEKCLQSDQVKARHLKRLKAGQKCSSPPCSVMDVRIQRKLARPADRALSNSNSCHTFSKHCAEQETLGNDSSTSKSSTHGVEDLPYDSDSNPASISDSHSASISDSHSASISDSYSASKFSLKPTWLLSGAIKAGRVIHDHEFLSRRRHSRISNSLDTYLVGNECEINYLHRPLNFERGNAVEGTDPSGRDLIETKASRHEGRKVSSVPFACSNDRKRMKITTAREKPCTDNDFAESIDLARPCVVRDEQFESQAVATLTESLVISSLSRTDSGLTTQTVNISSLTMTDLEERCGKGQEGEHAPSTTNSPVNGFLAGVQRGDNLEESDDQTWRYQETERIRCPPPRTRRCNDDVESLQISLDSPNVIDIPDGLSILQENNSKSETVQRRGLNGLSLLSDSPKFENSKEDMFSSQMRTCESGSFATKSSSPKRKSREQYERERQVESIETVNAVPLKPRRISKAERVQPKTTSAKSPSRLHPNSEVSDNLPKKRLVGTYDSDRPASLLLVGLGRVTQADADRVALEGFFCHDSTAKRSTLAGNNVRQFGVVIHGAATPSERQATCVYGTYRRQVEAAGKKFTWRFKTDGQEMV